MLDYQTNHRNVQLDALTAEPDWNARSRFYEEVYLGLVVSEENQLPQVRHQPILPTPIRTLNASLNGGLRPDIQHLFHKRTLNEFSGQFVC